MLIAHYVCLIVFVASSFSSIAIKQVLPQFYDNVFFPVFLTVTALTLLSWIIFKGCPLSRWENQLRILEGKTPYQGSCMVYNFQKITGRRVSSKLAHAVLVGIMTIPVVVRFLLE